MNQYQVLQLCGEEVLTRYRYFNGQPLPGDLDALEVTVAGPERKKPAGDFPGLTSHIPVFSRRAAAVFEDLLRGAGEWLPVRLVGSDPSQAYFALNVTRVVDGLDLKHARVKRFSSSNRIMRILAHAFLAEVVQGLPVFKIPETVLQEVYVSQAFVERGIRHGLVGAAFKLVWTDEAFLILCPYCAGIIAENTNACPTCGLDTRRDASWEVTLEEHRSMDRRRCPNCAVRIPAWADPCPYCKTGERRQGQHQGVTVI
jgi:RNA polymerase subunit RPABC4/transcription elongation factor Spt4